MEIKVSYVQARRFIDFHTSILNSYAKARKKLPLKVTSQPKGSEKEGNVTIQAPLPHIRISNTSCSFLAFSKAKNAHMGRGSPIRINVWESKFLTCKHDDSLISYIDPE